MCSPRNHPQNLGAEEAKALAPSVAMEGAFGLNMGMALCLNRHLPYGDKSPEMDFFEAAVKGNLDRLREMARGKDADWKKRLANVCVAGAVGPLQAAARLGRLNVVRCLVKEPGFDINGGSKDSDIGKIVLIPALALKKATATLAFTFKEHI